MSNNDIEAKVILRDTIMDDMRPLKKDGINRLVKTSTTSLYKFLIFMPRHQKSGGVLCYTL